MKVYRSKVFKENFKIFFSAFLFFAFILLSEPGGSNHAQKIEDVVDWREVVKRYLAMRGNSDVDGEETSSAVERAHALDDLTAVGSEKPGLAVT